jgi:hypothetical protein
VACEKLFVRVERETDMVVAVSFVLNVESVHWGSWTMGWTCVVRAWSGFGGRRSWIGF